MMYSNRDSQKVEKVAAVNLTTTRTSDLKSAGTAIAGGTFERRAKRKRDSLAENVAEISMEMRHESRGNLKQVLGKRRERNFQKNCCDELEDCAVIIGWKDWCAFEWDEYDDPTEALLTRRRIRRMLNSAAKVPEEEMLFVEASINMELHSQQSSETPCTGRTNNVEQMELPDKPVNAAVHAEKSIPIKKITKDGIQAEKNSQLNSGTFSLSLSTQCPSNSSASKNHTYMEGGLFLSEDTDFLKHESLGTFVQDENTIAERVAGSISVTMIKKAMDVIHIVDDLHQACQVTDLKSTVNFSNSINDPEEDDNAARVEYLQQETAAKGKSCDRKHCKTDSASTSEHKHLPNEIEGLNSLEEGIAEGASVHIISSITKKSRTLHTRKSKRVLRRSGGSCENEATEEPALETFVSCPICFRRWTADIRNKDFNTMLNHHIDSCINS